MITIGLTGGSGSGKTDIMKIWRDMGAFTVNADEVYRELLDESITLKAELFASFGREIFGHDGRIDRKKLSAYVFSDKNALNLLNSITHPHVIGEIDRIIAEKRPETAVIEAIALIESGMAEKYDAVVGVLAQRDLRIARIIARDGLTPEAAAARIDAQREDAFYRENCAYIIENNESRDELYKNAVKIYNKIIKDGKNG